MTHDRFEYHLLEELDRRSNDLRRIPAKPLSPAARRKLFLRRLRRDLWDLAVILCWPAVAVVISAALAVMMFYGAS